MQTRSILVKAGQPQMNSLLLGHLSTSAQLDVLKSFCFTAEAPSPRYFTLLSPVDRHTSKRCISQQEHFLKHQHALFIPSAFDRSLPATGLEMGPGTCLYHPHQYVRVSVCLWWVSSFCHSFFGNLGRQHSLFVSGIQIADLRNS